MERSMMTAVRGWMGCALAVAAGLFLGARASGADVVRPRVAFDRAGGFTVERGAEASVMARVVDGGGYGFREWEGNAPGRAEGRRNETWVIDTGEAGEYWLRAIGWCDGTDEEVRGTIRFRVVEPERAVRAAGEGESVVWSEDFANLSGSDVTEYNGWTGTKLFNGTNCLKVGSSKATGEAISPSASLGGNAGRVEFSLRAYGSDSTTVTLSGSVDGGAWSEWGTYSGLTDPATEYSVDVAACQSVQFKWTGNGKRFHLGPVAVYQSGSGGGGTTTSNEPPVLDLDPDVEAVTLFEGQEYEIEVTATEYDGDEITLSASGLPDADAWYAEDPATGSVTGEFIWTPETTGTWNVVFSATDKDGTTNRTVAFTVVPEGPGTLAFESDGVHVRESAGKVTLTVVRTNGAAGAVTVAWATMDGTASAGSEFVAGSGALAFADGQTEATLSVALVDDTTAEDNKSFSVVLGNVTGGASLGDVTTCTVTIVDDDDANASYYASCYRNGVLKTGDDLKDALCKILNTGVKTNSYGGGLDTILQVTDRNSTNGSSSQVRCIYLQSGITSFNKEHIWAQSHGIDGAGPAYSDLHHIRACNSTMNSTRGDKDFDNRQNVSGATEVNGCWYTSKAWEPPDSAKGDVARAVLYMDVRYENKYNGKVDLETVDSIGTSTDGNQLGKLSTLIAWNELDPPDDFERRRNELIYTTYQYNRNPFIDHPTWVRAVFDPSNFTEEAITWTVNVTAEGDGWVNNQTPPLSLEVTNGLTKAFYVAPDLSGHWHIGSISWNGALVPQAYYTNASYYNYTCPAVSNNSTLAVVFAPDTAALGTPVWWLVQYGGNEASVAQEDWNAAELEDWNDDGVPNWQEYVNGTDPTALSLRQVENVAVTATSAEGFTLGWDAVDYADYYKVRVCSTAVTEAAAAGFESGGLDSGWSTNSVGTSVMTNSALAGSYGLAFSTNGAWLCSPAVENPASVEFLYRRSSSTAAWALAVEVCENGSTKWTPVDAITNATTSAKTASIDLSAWCGKTVRVRLRDARESGAAARYVDAVKVYAGGATVAEGTSATTGWTATGLESGTTYGAMVCAVATNLGSATGKWSSVVSATTVSGDGRTAQTITFPQIANQVATNTVALGATASSGLAVGYTVSGNAVIENNVLRFTGAGSVTVTASQAGNEEYAPAASVSRTFNVTLAEQSIAWAEIGDQVETATVALSATATSGGTVTFAITSGNAVINGNTLSFTGTGSVTVTATQVGGALWAAASTSQTFTVSAVALGAPAEIWASATNSTGFTAAWSAVDGATGYELTVWTEGGGETTWTTNETVVLSNDFATITGNGNTKLTNGAIADWTFVNAYGATNEIRMGASSATGQVVTASVAVEGTLRVVAWARPWSGDTSDLWIEVNGTAVSNGLTAASQCITNEFTGLDGNYTIMFYTTSGNKHRVFLESVVATEVSVTEGTAGGTAVVPGYDALAVAGTSQAVTGLVPETAYSFHARATAGGGAGAWSETAEVTTLGSGGKSPQSIAFPQIADQIATNTVALGATATSGLAVTYTVTGNATESGGLLSFTGDGTVSVTASQAGDDSWEAAEDVTRTFNVSKATQTVSVEATGAHRIGDEVEVVASASSGLPVTLAAEGASLDGTTLTCTAAGTVTVTATQAGTALWEGASASVSFAVVDLSGVEFARIRTLEELEEGEYVITGEGTAGEEYAMLNEMAGGTTIYIRRGETAVGVVSNSIYGPDASLVWTLGETADGWTIHNADAGYVAYSGSGNSAMFTNVVVSNSLWTISASNDLFAVCNVASNRIMRYNAGSPRFACYVPTSSLKLLAFYKKVKTPQTITFAEIPDQVATNTLSLGATASSGLDVSYAVSGPATLDGNTLAFTGAGTVTVTASQPGDSTYAAAVDVEREFEVSLATQSITFGPIADQRVTDTVTLDATASSGLTVTYTVSGPATLSGTTLSFTNAGTVTVTASQTGNALYAAASDVPQTFTVSLLTQTINFPAIAAQVAPNTVTLSASASSGLDVTFVVESGPATLDGNTMTFTGAGMVVVTASQAGGGNYVAAADVTQEFVVSLAAQEITFGAIANQSVTDTVTLDATASSGLPVSYTVSGPATLTGTTLSFTGAGEVTVTAHQAGNAIWAAASDVLQSFEVSLLSQTIDFPEIASQVATNTLTLSATATSGLDVTFAVASGPATLDGNTLTFTGAGTVVVTASQTGGGNYAAAADVTQQFVVSLATQEITFGAIADQSVTDTVTLGATASSGLPVNYTVSGPATLSGTRLSFTDAGTVTVTASQTGNTLYAAASDVTQTFAVSLLSQTIDFPAIAAQVATNTLTLSASATSGLDVSFAVTSGPATLNGNMLTFTGAGTVVVTASQSGGGNYAAAADVTQEFAVSLAAQEITFGTIADQSVTDTVALDATASSGLAVSYTVDGPATLTGTTLSFTGAGEVTVTAHQAGNALWAAASDVVQTFGVSLLAQTIDFPAIAAQVATNTVTLSATATSDLDVTFAVASGPATLEGNTLTFTGAGTVMVTASQSGGGSYAAAADVTRTFVVAQAAQSITFGAIGAQSVGATVALSAAASSGLEVGYTVNGPATLSGTTLTCTNAGTVTVTASQGGNALWAAAENVSVSFEVSQTGQSITFPEIGNQWVTNTVELSATASSGLEVSYAVSGPATLDGTTLSFTGAGTVTVTASQGGNGMYDAAADVVRQFEVFLLEQSITFEAIGQQVATNTLTLSATATSGLDVIFVVASGPATLEGNTLAFTGAGTVVVVASQSGGGNYAAATDVERELAVTLAAQEITFGEIADQSVTDTVTLDATASSGLEVSYTVSGPATLSGTTLNFTGAGEVTVTAHQTGNALWAAAEEVTQSFTVSLLAQTIDFPEIAAQVATNMLTLSATATCGLDVIFAVASGPATLSGNTLTFTGAGEVTVTASQTGNESYEPATTNQTFTVTKASQSIDFGPIAEQTTGVTMTLEAIASSGLEVSYTVSGPASLSGNTLTCTNAGTVTVTASQGGNALYAAAEDVTREFEVADAEQTGYEAWLTGWELSAETEGLEYESAKVDDYDQDGVSNWLEYIADTNPDDGTDFLRLKVEMKTDGTWVAAPVPASTNRSYWLVTRSDLIAGELSEVSLGVGTDGLAVTNAMPEGRDIWFGIIRAGFGE